MLESVVFETLERLSGCMFGIDMEELSDRECVGTAMKGRDESRQSATGSALAETAGRQRPDPA